MLQQQIAVLNLARMDVVLFYMETKRVYAIEDLNWGKTDVLVRNWMHYIQPVKLNNL